jgi:hypothetical protein
VKRMLPLILAAALAAILATSASADAVYHTARVPLLPVAGAPGGGTVINIHANSPVIYAHEVYLLKHAVPGTYEIAIHIDPVSTDCSSPALDLTTAQLMTNEVGNGMADVKFTPADADGLRGLTVSAYWTAEGPASYASSCELITLD